MDRRTRRLGGSFLALATAGLVACGGSSPASEPGKMPVTTSSRAALQEYLVGRDLVEKLRATDANAHFAKAVELDPDFALAHLGLAQTAPGPVEFFASLRRAGELADRVSKAEANVIRAIEAGANSRPDELRRLLAANASAFPADERAQSMLGNSYFGSGEWQKAIDAYTKAIAIDPKFSAPYNQLGYALRHLDRDDESEKVFRTYTELIPDEPNPYDSHAELLLHLGRNEEAIAEYQKALDINPNFPTAYVGIGHAQMFLGRTDDARKSFVKLRFIARNDGETRQAYLWLAGSYLYQGDFDGAIREFEKRLEIAKGKNDTVSMAGDVDLIGQVLLEAGRADAAKARFDESLDLIERSDLTAGLKESGRMGHVAELARVALLHGDIETATAKVEEYRRRSAVRHVPNEEWMSHALLGLVAHSRGDYATAIRELELSNREDSRVQLAIARAKAAAGDRAGAIAACRRAMQFNGPDFSLAFAWRPAQALLKELTKEEAGNRPPARPS